MKNKRSGWLLMALGLILVVGVSCKSGGYLAGSEAADVTAYSARLKMKATFDKEKQTLSGLLKVSKDSLIQLSLLVPLIRSEAARIEISPDSTLIVDRVHKLFVRMPNRELSDFFRVEADFLTLQVLFTNAIFSSRRPRLELPPRSSMKAGERSRLKVRVDFSGIKAGDVNIHPTEVSARYAKVTLDELMENL